MPRSSKAPEPPPEPNWNEIIQNDVAKIKRLLGLDVNRLALGSEVEGIVEGGPFGPVDYTIKGVNTISFVNVSSSIGPAQGSSGPPAQVTGLTVTPQGGSNTQLNLAWTAITAPDFNYYNVYRGTTSGFTVGPSSEIAQPVTNSYNNIGLSPGTTYYYRVSTTNDAELEGTTSTVVSNTTTGAPPPTLLLHLDGNLTDSSGNGLTANNGGFIGSGNGYIAPGKFGTSGIKINTPTDGTPGNVDMIHILDDPLIRMNLSVGFSFSFWVWPTDITAAGPARRKLALKQDSSTDKWEISFDASGIIYFCLQKAGIDYKREKSGLTTGSWQHICIVFNGVSNTVEIYRNAVAGIASVISPQYVASIHLDMGVNGLSVTNTHYEGYFDEVQFFNLPLTQAQVTSLMNTNS